MSDTPDAGYAGGAKELLRHLPEVTWDVAAWIPGHHFMHGSVDVADRLRIVEAVLAVAEGNVCPACKVPPFTPHRSDCGNYNAYLANLRAAQSDRCQSMFVGLPCALPAGHEGAHRNSDPAHIDRSPS